MNEMFVSLIHGLHYIRFFDLLVLMCVLYIFKHIFEIIREEMQHRRVKMYAEMKLDTSALDILDNIINEALNEYTIFNMPAKEINYINSKEEEKIISYMQVEVAKRIPTTLYKKLEIILNTEYIGNYIGTRIYMTVLNYVLEVNTGSEQKNQKK